MPSGITIDDACLTTYNELKRKEIKFIIYRMSDDSKRIEVDLTSTDADYDAFSGSLPADDCRWAFYDFPYQTEDGIERNTLFFLAWSPDTARVRPKMMYASTKEALRKALNDTSTEIQATDPTEAGLDVFRSRVPSDE